MAQVHNNMTKGWRGGYNSQSVVIPKVSLPIYLDKLKRHQDNIINCLVRYYYKFIEAISIILNCKIQKCAAFLDLAFNAHPTSKNREIDFIFFTFELRIKLWICCCFFLPWNLSLKLQPKLRIKQDFQWKTDKQNGIVK